MSVQQAAIAVFINCKASQPVCTRLHNPPAQLLIVQSFTMDIVRAQQSHIAEAAFSAAGRGQMETPSQDSLDGSRFVATQQAMLFAAEWRPCCRCKAKYCPATSRGWVYCCRMRPSSAIFALGGLAGRSMLAMFKPTKVSHSKHSIHTLSCSPSSVATLSYMIWFAAPLFSARLCRKILVLW